ncbi:NAD(P)-dependent oxidoreductase [Accumulibacter sp.]|uniref:NAD-dependent epimerase/dehydratase family protein n=1 Tax=Accumulibacter sp. TaxID=2053492 RepID=UPI00260F0F7D|nr:NAD(P)-dependent oxidoreductase [Accumulibacter sp.]
MKHRVLITGSAGLIGTALRIVLEERGVNVVGLDLLGNNVDAGDVRDPRRVRSALVGCDGVVHLAAVSRVVWGELDPDGCWATNVGGLRNVIEQVERQHLPPWLIFASSREVYGQPAVLPATEDSPLRPVNYYGRSKVEGELLVTQARATGMRAAIIRFSNVYGSVGDHADRVVPAFAWGALTGGTLLVHGADCSFDFTHIDDAVRGILAIIDRFNEGHEAFPPIHFATGRATTLWQLATLAVDITGSSSFVTHGSPRQFDVSHFCGSPERARRILGWKPCIPLRDGLSKLIDEFRSSLDAKRSANGAPPRA